MRFLLSPVLAFLLVAGIAWGDVKGTFEVAGKKVELTHAYALQYDNEEKLIEEPELRILLVDREIDPALLSLAVPMDLNALATQGKLWGVLLRSTKSKDGYAMQATVYYQPKDPRQSMIFFTHSGTEPVFKRLEVKGGTVSGEVEDASESDSDDGTSFKMALTFSTPVLKRDAVTARFKGADAAASAPAKAMLEFSRASRAGDLEAARKVATESRMKEMDEAVKQMGKEAYVKEASQWIPEPSKLAKQIVEVVVRGKRAVVIFEEDGNRNCADMILDGEVWKGE